MQSLQPRHHYYVLGFVSAVAALHVWGAAAPALYAETPDASFADTAFTAQLPIDPTPTLAVANDVPTATLTPPPCLFLQQPVPCAKGDQQKSAVNVEEKKFAPTTDSLARLLQQLRQSGATSEEINKVKQLSLLVKLNRWPSPTPSTPGEAAVLKHGVDVEKLVSDVAGIQSKIDMTTRLRLLNRSLNRLELLLKNQKLADLGLDADELTKYVAVNRAGYIEAKKNFELGTSDGLTQAHAYLESVVMSEYSDIERVVQGLKELRQITKLIKQNNDNAEVVAELNTSVGLVTVAFNSGKYHDARVLLDSGFKELVNASKTALRLQRGRPGTRAPIVERLKKVEQHMREQLQNEQKANQTTNPAAVTTESSSVPPTSETTLDQTTTP